MLKFVGLFLVVLAQGFSSYAADDHPRRGIDHIDPLAYKYAFFCWSNRSQQNAFPGYGYHYDRESNYDQGGGL